MKKLRLFLFLLIPISLLLMAFSFMAQTDFGSLEAVMTWVVVGGGAMALAGAVVALLLENWSGWHGFPVWVKTTVPIVLAGLFSILASVGLSLNAGAAIPEPYATLVLMFVNWLASQIAYTKAKNAGYASKSNGETGSGKPPA